MNERLEPYLSEVGFWLRWLPAARRRDEIAELRSHLENAVAEAMMGQDGDALTQDAIQDATIREVIRQFGPARRVALQLGLAHGRSLFTRFRGDFAVSFLASFLTYKIISLTLLAAVSLLGYNVFPAGYSGVFSGFLVAVAMGVMGASFAPRKAVEGAIACFLFVALAPAILSNLHPILEPLANGAARVTLLSLPLTLLSGLFYVSGAAMGKFFLTGRSQAHT